MTAVFCAEHTAYETGRPILLRESRYWLTDDGFATLRDDGYIDEVAVDRAISGDAHVRLTPREVICVVARAAGLGLNDHQIAELFASSHEGSYESVCKIRRRNRIPAGWPRYESSAEFSTLRERAMERDAEQESEAA